MQDVKALRGWKDPVLQVVSEFCPIFVAKAVSFWSLNSVLLVGTLLEGYRNVTGEHAGGVKVLRYCSTVECLQGGTQYCARVTPSKIGV